MTMTDSSSPPPSPTCVRLKGDLPLTDISLPTSPSSTNGHPEPRQPLPISAINKNLYYHFPTPPNSPPSPSYLSRAIVSPGFPPHNANHARTGSRTFSAHARRRSSASISSRFRRMSIDEYGPPPNPPPAYHIPPTPGAPRIPFTTPAQERNRYSAGHLYDRLLAVQRADRAGDVKLKRHSAP